MTDGTRTRERAHCASYRMFVGPIPKGSHVLHSCDVRNCVNPAHLSIGDAKENMRQARVRGRLAIGEKHYAETVNAWDVVDIKYGDMFGKPRTVRNA